MIYAPGDGKRDEQKRAAAHAALEFVASGEYLGVGTGSTSAHFVRELAESGIAIRGAIPSSIATEELLRHYGLPVADLVKIGRLPVYVDGADEADRELRLIKGGGGALTREKIVACSSDLFVCIVDESKVVERLGAFPLAVEVVPMAVVHVQRRILRLDGQATIREGFETDNGNLVLDVHGLELSDPLAMERALDGIVGVVTNGLIARRPADILLVGDGSGVVRYERTRPSDKDEWP